MSWNLNVSGHIQAAEKDVLKLEQELVTRIRSLVKDLLGSHGVHNATLNGSQVGQVDLTQAEAGEDAPKAGGSAAKSR